MDFNTISHYQAGLKRTVTYSTRENDPFALGEMVKDVLNKNALGDEFSLGPGYYSWDQSPLNLHNIALYGAGSSFTVLTGKVFSDELVSGAFSVGQTTISDLTLQTIPDPDYEDDRCVSKDVAGSCVTNILSCLIKAGAWGVYGWPVASDQWKLVMRNTIVESGLQCLTGQGSGNPDAQSFIVEDCVFDVDASRTKCSHNQAVNDAVYGGCLAVALRTGTHTFNRLTVRIKGGLNVNNCVGITDTYKDGPRPNDLKIDITDLTCTIEPNGTPIGSCYDLALKHPTSRANLTLSGTNKGSGNFRSLRMRNA